MKKTILSILLSTAACLADAQQLTVTQVYSGFSQPVDIKHAGDDRLFIVEKPGNIRIIDSAGSIRTTPFLNIQSRVLYTAGSERGLLGLAFDPNYAVNGYFYLNYTSKPSGNTKISRLSVDPSNPDSALASSEEVLLEIYQPYSNHNGGHLAFGPDGYLYVGMGDGGSGGDPGNRAQNLDTLLGKMLRIDVSSAPGYTIPASNPFVGVAGRDEIWASGVRNPWRFSFDRLTGDLWIGDVGQSVREEVDFQASSSPGGENYGWRCYEGDQVYNTTGGTCPPYANTAQPVYVYDHTGGNCSITGGYIYRGAEYANLFGKYFFTDYCTATLRSLVKNTGGVTFTNYGLFAGNSYVSFGENKYGEIYLSSLNGQIYKLGDTACLPVAYITDLDTLHVCGASTELSTPAGRNFTYSWTFNGSPIPGSNSPALQALQSGTYSVSVTNPAFCTNISADVYVLLDSVPTVSFSGLDTVYCQFDAPVTLTGTPAGGAFMGNGITGNIFDPAAAGIGMVGITYAYTTPGGCSTSSYQQTRVDVCTGISPLEDAKYVSLFPNPARNTLDVRSALFAIERVELYNLVGQRVRSEKPATGKGKQLTIDVSALAPGTYFVKVFTEKGTVTQKLRKD